MTTRPTYDDANLILRLYDMRREERLRKARAWFIANFKVRTWDDFQKVAAPGTDENASYRMVVSYWDMVASFISSGVLHKELFFQSGRELLVVWERMRDLLPELRDRHKDPFAYQHLEIVGNEYATYLKGKSADSYEAFLKRVT